MYKLSIEKTKKEGYFTVKCESDSNSFYLHSKYNPENEAMEFAKGLVEASYTNVLIYGLGLGYHVLALWEAFKNVPHNILVVETNSDVIELFGKYGVYNELSKTDVKIITPKS